MIKKQKSIISAEVKERQQTDIAKLKEIKSAAYHERKNNDDHWAQRDDYMVTIVFDTKEEKQAYMKKLNQEVDKKYIPAKVIYG